MEKKSCLTKQFFWQYGQARLISSHVAEVQTKYFIFLYFYQLNNWTTGEVESVMKNNRQTKTAVINLIHIKMDEHLVFCYLAPTQVENLGVKNL